MDRSEVYRSLSRYSHLLYKVIKWRAGSASNQDDVRKLTTFLDEADIITSQMSDRPGYHTLMLDLDVPAKLVPSTTQGHSHLYIDVPMHWLQYREVLAVMADAGIIERGYEQVSVKHQMTSLRLPWVKKKANN